MVKFTKQEARPARKDFMDTDVQKVFAAVAGEVGNHPKLGGTVKIDFGEPGSIWIDGTGEANAAADGHGKTADCTVSLSLETMKQLRDGAVEPMAAFFKGKLRVSGDFSLAAKLGPIMQKARS